jgi:hypothetical protein
MPGALSLDRRALPTANRVGVFIAVFSVVFLEIWYLLLARRLYQLGRGAIAEAIGTPMKPSGMR